jgi:hypothetical protein
MDTPAMIPKKVNATVCVCAKYVALSSDLYIV